MSSDGHLLGFDVGSSSIKASLLDAGTGLAIASATSPATELSIEAKHAGWAEQDPSVWWENVVAAAAALKSKSGTAFESVKGIGITYQMHGLVLVDKAGALLRPSIIWCDSRAVDLGEKAFHGIGETICLTRLLNSPGNFTASKLAWVKENEPAIFDRAKAMLLPGDWIAYRMTGEMNTTASGLSESILWDFLSGSRSDLVLDWFGIPKHLIPRTVETFAVHGGLTAEAANALGLKKGTAVCYRAGDQPNNAFSLNVLQPGELAATAGTSGVVYGIIDQPRSDKASRVNTFVHVNHAKDNPRYGVLLCVSGAGILYSWLRRLLVGDSGTVPYDELNRVAAQAVVGAEGLQVFPFGNGAERTLENKNPGASIIGLEFNRHGIPHLLRAGQEGIVYALQYGLGIMKEMGLRVQTVRAGHANMFLSPLFREAFATITGARVELFDTDGAQGAARGAGIGAGIYSGTREALAGLRAVKTAEPNKELAAAYGEAYGKWERALRQALSLE